MEVHDPATAEKMIRELRALGLSVAADGITLHEAWCEGYDFWFPEDGMSYLPLTARAKDLQARMNAAQLTPEEKLECAEMSSASCH
jgi:hypothetical protein